PRGVGEPAEGQEQDQRRQVATPAQTADPRPQPVAVPHQVAARYADEDSHIFMGTGVNAVEAEGAVEVPQLPGLEQAELAARDAVAAANAVAGPARCADVGTSDRDLQRRDLGVYEVKLADRANVLAERGPAEESIDDERRDEVADDDSSGPARPIPERKRFV